jgi:hypothetical protein
MILFIVALSKISEFERLFDCSLELPAELGHSLRRIGASKMKREALCQMPQFKAWLSAAISRPARRRSPALH